MMKTKFIRDTESGDFAIEVNGKRSDTTKYEHIATVRVDGVLYGAVTQYFDGYLPTEKIFRMELIPGVEVTLEKLKK